MQSYLFLKFHLFIFLAFEQTRTLGATGMITECLNTDLELTCDQAFFFFFAAGGKDYA